jgi:hypothetical protein
MLKKTSTPYSLSRPVSDDLSPSFPSSDISSVEVIERTKAIPANRPYSRPDLRNVGREQEALLTFETQLSRISSETRSTAFEMPVGDNEHRRLRLSVELVRDHSSLWSQIRLRLEPSQMSMDLGPDPQMRLEFPEADLLAPTKTKKT